ncbi:MAG TPA: hypothetical protein VIH61_09105 [Waddliaceae bacterium]
MIQGDLPCEEPGCSENANWRIEQIIEPEYYEEFKAFEAIGIGNWHPKNYCEKHVVSRLPNGLIKEGGYEHWPPHKFQEYWSGKTVR